MANGYARATGRVGVLLTIPGPGFTYALTGIAEALLDSAPIVHIVGAPAVRADGGFALQAISQTEIAAPLTKGVLRVERVEEIEATLAEAFALAASGEPGPVVVQVGDAALQARTDAAEPGELPEAGHAGGGPGDGVAAAAESSVPHDGRSSSPGRGRPVRPRASGSSSSSSRPRSSRRLRAAAWSRSATRSASASTLRALRHRS